MDNAHSDDQLSSPSEMPPTNHTTAKRQKKKPKVVRIEISDEGVDKEAILT